MILTACGGGGSSATPPVTTTPPPPPPPPPISQAFLTEGSTSQFLGRATFGASFGDISTLTGTAVSDWIIREFDKTPTNYFPTLLIEAQNLPAGEQLRPRRVSDLFFDAAIAGDDQLRQRMVFALSEIIVVSDASQLINVPLTMADYVDTLSDNAFGNYRELLEHITYTPAMSVYLTYIANEKGDPSTGRVPDENYARELMQLFTLGLVELNLDGTPILDGQGQSIEIYDNTDITGLAKVFTGLSLDGNNFFNLGEDPTAFYRPLKMFPDFHSTLEKSFLGTTIPAGTGGEESIDLALDTIFNHPNMAPFLSRQLIQRFVTSDPAPTYVARVATAFETGRFTLPNNAIVGDGRRGDLKATIAAVLLDGEALQDRNVAPAEFGKVREPILRFTNWARAFGETTPDSGDERLLVSTNITGLGQHPFRSPSVFNFFRPGYVAPGTATGAAGLTAPELEIINESSAIGYINFINAFIYDFGENISGDPEGGVKADYTDLVVLADDAQSLIDRLDLVLTGNGLDPEFKANMLEMMNDIPISTTAPDEDRLTRILVAISMTMTAPGYAVQR
jgi:uncharacterized protein (DUF1800 family)